MLKRQFPGIRDAQRLLALETSAQISFCLAASTGNQQSFSTINPTNRTLQGFGRGRTLLELLEILGNRNEAMEQLVNALLASLQPGFSSSVVGNNVS